MIMIIMMMMIIIIITIIIHYHPLSSIIIITIIIDDDDEPMDIKVSTEIHTLWHQWSTFQEHFARLLFGFPDNDPQWLPAPSFLVNYHKIVPSYICV